MTLPQTQNQCTIFIQTQTGNFLKQSEHFHFAQLTYVKVGHLSKKSISSSTIDNDFSSQARGKECFLSLSVRCAYGFWITIRHANSSHMFWTITDTFGSSIWFVARKAKWTWGKEPTTVWSNLPIVCAVLPVSVQCIFVRWYCYCCGGEFVYRPKSLAETHRMKSPVAGEKRERETNRPIQHFSHLSWSDESSIDRSSLHLFAQMITFSYCFEADVNKDTTSVRNCRFQRNARCVYSWNVCHLQQSLITTSVSRDSNNKNRKRNRNEKKKKTKYTVFNFFKFKWNSTSLFSSTAEIRFKYKPIVTSVNEVPVDMTHKAHKKHTHIHKHTKCKNERT